MYNYDDELEYDSEAYFKSILNTSITVVNKINASSDPYDRPVSVAVIKTSDGLREIVIVDKIFKDLHICSVIKEEHNTYTSKPYIPLAKTNVTEETVMDLYKNGLISNNYIFTMRQKGISTW